MNFIPNTEQNIKEMLDFLKIKFVNELFKDVGEEFILKKPLKLPKAMSELELQKHMKELSEKNKQPKISLLGAGAYNHYIPSVVDHILRRSEFYTAYTPYQPEISQGALQSIYEFQTMICKLTGMDVANASMYDGASAMAEAAMMAHYTNRRNEIIISEGVHPQYYQTVFTYANARGLKVIRVGFKDSATMGLKDGVTDISEIKNKISENTACVIIQNPNYYGQIEDIEKIAAVAHEKKALLIVGVVEPTSLGILKSPGECCADIVIGEGQSFGVPLSYGGPYVGFMACKKQYMRKLPGRIVGATVDSEGKRGYILTLQAREQHIRREKATSNICTNHALIALANAVYLSYLGKNLKQIAELNLQKAHYLAEKISKLKGYGIMYGNNFYNEFVVYCKDANETYETLAENGIVGGLELDSFFQDSEHRLLFCVTETMTKQDMDKIVEVLKKCN